VQKYNLILFVIKSLVRSDKIQLNTLNKNVIVIISL